MTHVRKSAFFCLVLLFPLLCIGQTLRVSLSPVLASLPIAFAEEWGLFDEHGVDVEIIGMTDNDVRSAALSTGDLDLVMADVTQFLVDLNGGQELVTTSAAYIRSQTASLQLALVAPDTFRMETIGDLAESGYIVGTVFRSDHEYLLDRLFDSQLGDDVDRPRYSYMTDILFLATWFGAQMMPAAVLPEPYISYIATYAPPGGRPVGIVKLDDFSDFGPLPPTLLIFRADYVDAHPQAVQAFYDAYGEAIERINATPRAEIVDTGLSIVLPLFFQGANPDLIGQDVLDALEIPWFESPVELPCDQFESVLAWALEKGYAVVRPDYAAVVDGRFIP